MGAVIETEMIGPRKEVPHTSFYLGLGSHLNDNTIGTAAKETSQSMPLTVAPLPDEHQSGQPIKTEMELTVLF